LIEAKEATKSNTGLTLLLALNYSGRWEIVQAAKRMMKEIEAKRMQLTEINESAFASFLDTAAIPDPELVIRTSGEMRISNFLLWQMAYAEFYFTKTLWPDFRRENLFEAIAEYQTRERRFGKVLTPLK
jgi:undecaprenyl diphosphate synthase